jgi:protein TonB
MTANLYQRVGFHLRPGRIVALWATAVLHLLIIGTLWLVRPAAELWQQPAPPEPDSYTPVEIRPPPPAPPPEPLVPVRPPEPVQQTLAPPPPPILDAEESMPSEPIQVVAQVVPEPETPTLVAIVNTQVMPESNTVQTLREGIDYHCRSLNYPRNAELRGDQGTVGLRLRIDRGGRLAAAEVARSSGHSSLDRAALRWVRSCRFTPPALDAGSMEARADLPVVFRVP